MSNAERTYIGLCGFFALVVAYRVFIERNNFLILTNTLLLVITLVQLRGHRRRRQQRDHDAAVDH